jgi:hypothetical protein
MTRTIVTPLLLLTIATAILRGQEQQLKPNLSRTWIFNAQKSSLKVPVPSSMTLRITHKDPQIRFARTQVYGDKTFEWKLEAITDDKKEVVQKSLAYTSHSRIYWQGGSLVLDQKLVADDGTTVNDVVTYTLSTDGQSLEAVEQLVTVGATGSVTNKWTYERRTQ